MKRKSSDVGGGGDDGDGGSKGKYAKDNRILDWVCEFLFKQGLADAAMEIIFGREKFRNFKDSTLLTHLEEFLKMKRAQLVEEKEAIDFVEREWEIAISILLRMGKMVKKYRTSTDFSDSIKTLFFIVILNIYEYSLLEPSDDGEKLINGKEINEVIKSVYDMFGRESVILEESGIYKTIFSDKMLEKDIMHKLKFYFNRCTKMIKNKFDELIKYIGALRKEVPVLMEESKAQLLLEVAYKDINNGLYAPSVLTIDDMKVVNGNKSGLHGDFQNNDGVDAGEKGTCKNKKLKRRKSEGKERFEKHKEEEKEEKIEKDNDKKKEVQEHDGKQQDDDTEEEEYNNHDEGNDGDNDDDAEKKHNHGKKDDDDDDEKEQEQEHMDKNDVIDLIRSGKVPKYSLSDMKRAFPNPTKYGWDPIASQTDSEISDFKNERLREKETERGKEEKKRERDDSDNNSMCDIQNCTLVKAKSDALPKRDGFDNSVSTVRRPFSEDEENALIKGVQRFGEGKWALILKEYKSHFIERTGVNLKDKWRNIKKKASKENDKKILIIASEATQKMYPQASFVSPPLKKAKRNDSKPISKENDDIYTDDDD